MPLTIIDAERDLDAASQVFWEGVGCHFNAIGAAGMGGFWVSDTGAPPHAMFTSGALTCVIIVMRTTDGYGSLGHYPGHPAPGAILSGVRAMIDALHPKPVEDVLFAAGMMLHEADQAPYQEAILRGTQDLIPGCQPSWVLTLANGMVPDSAMFLPVTGQVALFDTAPRSIVGRSDDGNGLREFSYPAYP